MLAGAVTAKPRRYAAAQNHQHREGLGIECTVPVEVDLATEHADVGSLGRAVSAALAEVGVALWRELVGHLEDALPTPAVVWTVGAR